MLCTPLLSCLLKNKWLLASTHSLAYARSHKLHYKNTRAIQKFYYNNLQQNQSTIFISPKDTYIIAPIATRNRKQWQRVTKASGKRKNEKKKKKLARDQEGNSKRNCENGKWKVGVAGKRWRIYSILSSIWRKIATHDARSRNEREDYRDRGRGGGCPYREGGEEATLTNKGCAREEGRNDTWTREEQAKERQLAGNLQRAEGRRGGNKRKQQTTSANGRF